MLIISLLLLLLLLLLKMRTFSQGYINSRERIPDPEVTTRSHKIKESRWKGPPIRKEGNGWKPRQQIWLPGHSRRSKNLIRGRGGNLRGEQSWGLCVAAHPQNKSFANRRGAERGRPRLKLERTRRELRRHLKALPLPPCFGGPDFFSLLTSSVKGKWS